MDLSMFMGIHSSYILSFNLYLTNVLLYAVLGARDTTRTKTLGPCCYRGVGLGCSGDFPSLYYKLQMAEDTSVNVGTFITGS